MKIKVILLTIIIVQFSCNKNNDEKNTIEITGGIYPEEYIEYYENKAAYEFRENTKLLNSDILAKSFSIDSLNLVPFSQNRTGKKRLDNKIIFQMIEKKYFNAYYYTFYQNIELVYDNDYRSFLLIEYPLDENARKKVRLFAIKYSWPLMKIDDYKKVSYVIWSTLPAYERGVNTKKYLPIYLWGINKTTDTITTNLSIESIKMLYPEFEGKYIFKKYDSIVVDYNYIDNFELFFKKIKFFE